MDQVRLAGVQNVSIAGKISLGNRLSISIFGGFIAFGIFLTIYVIILPGDKAFDTSKDSSLVDFVRLKKMNP